MISWSVLNNWKTTRRQERAWLRHVQELFESSAGSYWRSSASLQIPQTVEEGIWYDTGSSSPPSFVDMGTEQREWIAPLSEASDRLVVQLKNFHRDLMALAKILAHVEDVDSCIEAVFIGCRKTAVSRATHSESGGAV